MPNNIDVKQLPSGYKITLYGQPKPWSAPTFSKHGTYDKKWQYKRDAALLITSQKLSPLKDELSMNVVFFMAYPTNTSKKKKAIYDEELTPHTKVPDVDNMRKMVSDILQTAALIENDSQIWTGFSTKVLSPNPRTEITIIETKEKL